MPANDRLRAAIAQRGVTPESVAEACEVDPKTVGRWIAGRVPHPRHRAAAAQFLRVEEHFLWADDSPLAYRTATGHGFGLVHAYGDRASVPREVWIKLLTESDSNIDVLVFSGTFFAQINPQVADMLAERARDGVQVRLCFGDPAGVAVGVRGAEEGIGDSLAAKVRASLTYYRTLPSLPGVEVRLHDTTLYCSVFRYDDDLLANPHIWGQPASANPVLHVQRVSNGGGWFERYARSFEDVWEHARAWEPSPEEGVHGPHRVLQRPERSQGQLADSGQQPARGE